MFDSNRLFGGYFCSRQVPNPRSGRPVERRTRWLSPHTKGQCFGGRLLDMLSILHVPLINVVAVLNLCSQRAASSKIDLRAYRRETWLNPERGPSKQFINQCLCVWVLAVLCREGFCLLVDLTCGLFNSYVHMFTHAGLRGNTKSNTWRKEPSEKFSDGNCVICSVDAQLPRGTVILLIIYTPTNCLSRQIITRFIPPTEKEQVCQLYWSTKRFRVSWSHKLNISLQVLHEILSLVFLHSILSCYYWQFVE